MLSFEKLISGPIARKTGFSVRVGESGVQVLRGRVWAENVSLENPATYPSRSFLDVSSLSASVRWVPGGNGFNVAEAAVHVRRITGVRNRCGQTNFTHFRDALERDDNGVLPRRSGSSRRSRRVRKLVVSLAEVEIIDHEMESQTQRLYPVHFSADWNDVELGEAAACFLRSLEKVGLSREDAIFASVLPARLWGELMDDCVNPLQ